MRGEQSVERAGPLADLLQSRIAQTAVADGVKRAKIKEAEGYKRAQVLHAEGEAEAIMLVNEAADKYFTGNAQLLKKLETVEAALKSNSKIVIPAGSELVNIIGEMAGVLPLPAKHRGNGESKNVFTTELQ